jgi:hypothetical protein
MRSQSDAGKLQCKLAISASIPRIERHVTRQGPVPVRVSLDHIPADETLVTGPYSDYGDPVAEANWPDRAFRFANPLVAAQWSQLHRGSAQIQLPQALRAYVE